MRRPVKDMRDMACRLVRPDLAAAVPLDLANQATWTMILVAALFALPLATASWRTNPAAIPHTFSPPRYQIAWERAEWPEWSVVPGIGETIARRIVAWRERQGGFLRPDDLLAVPGIGPHRLQLIRPYLADDPKNPRVGRVTPKRILTAEKRRFGRL